ncbi:ChaB family protein [Nocardiopsis changdeensis]|uniref:ChaB family protein n=1 Tax=Nocardiopsis changdeensis TaxID=2831969 RepID=A0ABX8BE18_9ACTN|nr:MULTISPECIES: ChaB family protein [Nocardiopsis]QUX20277.1 ChaB family protein [Nocardiopsis changdeensis]QYX36207.1 ChaB family protein [Nocardiopsis sp. MT53]
MPGTRELPDTLRRSSKKAQRTWIKAHDSAVDQYGEGERAHRVAMAAVKHSFEKVGDHWEAKDGKGASDSRASDPGAKNRKGSEGTAGGVDANASKDHLYEQARRLGVQGRSKMTKAELVDALRKESGTRTKRARG